MSTLGFTGTRHMAGSEDRLYKYLERGETQSFLSVFDGFVTGGCRGWDAYVGRYLALRFPPPQKSHLVIVPGNQSQVDPWWEEFDPGLIQVMYMDENSDYRSRNEEIVRRSSQLFYCADYPEEHGKSRRSGTWMTKRIAEAANLPIHGIILNQE